MEDKENLNEDELDKVAGGSLIGVIAICHCGGKITSDCEARHLDPGIKERKCPFCGNWLLVEE